MRTQNLAFKRFEHAPILDVSGEEDETNIILKVERPVDPCKVPSPADERGKADEREEDTIIERKNPQGSTYIEVSESMIAVSRVIEDSGNQESGKDEKNLHSSPSPLPQSGHWRQDVMLTEYHKNGARPDPVESRIELLFVESRKLCCDNKTWMRQTISFRD
jgi:hypothetical protein